MTDMVHHPPHYNAYSIEVIEVTRHCSFNIGNAIKYMLRHPHKGASQQDLEKALWYLDDHIQYKHIHDQRQLVDNGLARSRLITLAGEYTEQEGMVPSVSAALATIATSNAPLAAVYLQDGIRSISHPTE